MSASVFSNKHHVHLMPCIPQNFNLMPDLFCVFGVAIETAFYQLDYLGIVEFDFAHITKVISVNERI